MPVAHQRLIMMRLKWSGVEWSATDLSAPIPPYQWVALMQACSLRKLPKKCSTYAYDAPPVSECESA